MQNVYTIFHSARTRCQLVGRRGRGHVDSRGRRHVVHVHKVKAYCVYVAFPPVERHLFVCVCDGTCIDACVLVCVYISVCALVCGDTCVSVCVRVRACVRVSARVCVYMCVYLRTMCMP